MAKSLRSKWRRKMKAAKRERYSVKEKDRLIKMLKAAGEYPQVPGEVKVEKEDEGGIIEADMDEVQEIQRGNTPTFKKRAWDEKREGMRTRRSRKDQDEDQDGDNTEDNEMAVDKTVHIFSKRTMKDQFGNYPAWMNKRKMLTQQKKNKRIAKRKAIAATGGKKKLRR